MANKPESIAQLIELLDFEQFDIPRNQDNSTEDFPTYLETELDAYQEYYERSLKPRLDDIFPSDATVAKKIAHLSDGINGAVQLYYKGKLPEAAASFKKALEDIGFANLSATQVIAAGRNFYRTRASTDKQLVRKDLFHNPFKNRGIVATSRYSIPGLPALYLGDSTYVCWEEFNRKPIRELYFSRFCSTEDLHVIKIQRLEDFIKQLKELGSDFSTARSMLMRYLSLFPLSIACSIRTKSNTDTFKPEYIIPQLLLQFVISLDNVPVNGIMFPSTKVKYSKIQNVPAYNFIFPVRNVNGQEYCSDLVRQFALTAPTSIELHMLTNFSSFNPLTLEEGLEHMALTKYVTILDDEKSSYATTAFGTLERILQQLNPARLENA